METSEPEVCAENADAAAELLSEALNLSADSLTLTSREPLGDGSVTGFEVDGEEQSLLYYVDTSRLPVTQETGLALGSSSRPEARVWLHPADPHLPALGPVAFHRAAEVLLERIGHRAAAPPEFVAYRPGRRAVLRIEIDGSAVWVKVVKPSRIDRIVRTHAACEQAGLPVPEAQGWAPEGIMLLAQAEGKPALHFAGEPDVLLDQVDRLRERISAVDVADRVPGVAVRLQWYASSLAAGRGRARAGAELVRRIERIADTVRAILPPGDESRSTQVVHGDLHLGQLFVDAAGELSGVIDIDTIGRGDQAEDPAAFIAHATASALLTQNKSRGRVWGIADAAMARWGGDPAVRALFATHMLGHALGARNRGESSMEDELLSAAEAVLDGGVPSAAMTDRSLSKNALTDV
ncbi:phosphotransferase [Leucobacter sp. GX24907]